MISKELLSEVLENEVPYQVKVHKIIIKNNSLNYFYNSKDSRGGLFEANEYINIYELAHKCKEWALRKNYTLLSSIEIDCGYCNISFIINNKANNKLITGATEVEAIIKACEWILEEIK